MTTPILEIQNIDAGYDRKTVIKNISLNIYPQDFIGFIGPNGGGKTTLVKVITGLLEHSKGKIISHKANLSIGYLAQKQDIDLQFPIQVKQVIASGINRKWTGRLSKVDLKQVDTLLEKLELLSLKDSSISEISGGEMQRALLGRAIISKPDLVILDEPNTYLDIKSEKILYKLLNELNNQMAIILVSHDLGTISSYVKSIACINTTLHYHPGNEITDKMLETYQCPVELITHGKVPHRVLKDHNNE